MSEVNDWNAAIIAEFRERRQGRRSFEVRLVVLMHHVGRRSGKELGEPGHVPGGRLRPATIFVFASRAAPRRTRTGTGT